MVIFGLGRSFIRIWWPLAIESHGFRVSHDKDRYHPCYCLGHIRPSNVPGKVLRELDDYLETKRVYFPRFYFISTNELVLVLACRDPQVVQAVLHKLFHGIAQALRDKQRRVRSTTPLQRQCLLPMCPSDVLMGVVEFGE